MPENVHGFTVEGKMSVGASIQHESDKPDETVQKSPTVKILMDDSKYDEAVMESNLIEWQWGVKKGFNFPPGIVQRLLDYIKELQGKAK